MIHSTLGFIYAPDFDQVLLIKKQRPAFHKDKLNGLGGKCEAEESGPDCVAREVEEECGLVIPAQDWKKVGVMSWEEWHVEIFVTIYQGEKKNAKTLTEDEVRWYPTHPLPLNVLTNLPWLIPLGIDYLTNDLPPTVEITYLDAKK
jgi:8-oxo-dGTP pyrophosphatase MutT (NUDIX family)